MSPLQLTSHTASLQLYNSTQSSPPSHTTAARSSHPPTAISIVAGTNATPQKLSAERRPRQTCSASQASIAANTSEPGPVDRCIASRHTCTTSRVLSFFCLALFLCHFDGLDLLAAARIALRYPYSFLTK
ncbi:hypothetical protein M011DRAFT_299706 [Sporormia fimetaria CBS 119925]|uniref:Uncharacterized protein n=1 Tax=Sporormia fimetaria CBS 119925 TaxID=1340428 RepID=A0A6A6UY05_9PLEO|nr:hypothetical protein M011DRAFT_299706 [Sporormia fimetaria CBS 119925]